MDFALILAFGAALLAVIALVQSGSLQARLLRLEFELAKLRKAIQVGESAEPDVQAAEKAVQSPAAQPTAAPQPWNRVTVSQAPPAAPTLASAAGALAEAAGLPVHETLQGAFDEDLALPPHYEAAAADQRRQSVFFEDGGPVSQLVERARSSGEWESLIGGRWLNRVGAAALILGTGFFFKYAVDNNWIPQPLRVAIGILVGFAFLYGARETHRRDLPIFAQGITGAGLAILYLSIYASSGLYHLIPQPVALLAMAGLTALAFALALTYDSLAVALLASAGGFLSVPLLGIASGTEAEAMGFVLMLDIGILSIVFRRDDWFVLEPIAMAASYGTYLGWFASSYRSSDLGLAGVALALLWTVFYAMDVSRILTARTTHRNLRHSLGGSNIVLAFIGMALLLQDHTAALGAVVLVQAAIYISTILVTKRTLQNGDALDARYTVTAILLSVIATPALFSGFAIPILWSFEALALLWCGVRWNLAYIWWPSIGLYGLASLGLSAAPGAFQAKHLHTFVPVLNARALAFVVLASTLATAAWKLRKLKHAGVLKFVSAFQYAWCATLFILAAVETNDLYGRRMIGVGHLSTLHLEQQRSFAIALLWAVLGLPLVFEGLRRRVFPVLASGLAITALAVGLGAGSGVSYEPIERFVPVFNDRVFTLVALAVILIAHSWWLARNRAFYPWLSTAVAGYRAVILLLGFELLTSEVHDYFRHASGSLSETGGAAGLFIELTTLAAIWMLYSFPMVRYGIRNRALSVLLIGLGSMIAATGAGAIAAVAFQPDSWLSTALSLRPILLLGLCVGLLFRCAGRVRASRSIPGWRRRSFHSRPVSCCSVLS